MAESVSIAELFASLGAKVDGSSWAKADAAMAKAKLALQDLDRQADKLATSTQAARASARAAALRDRDSAAAGRAIRQLEREEQRAAGRQVRAQQMATALRERDEQRAAATSKRLADRQANEAEARHRQMVSRIESSGAMLSAVFGGLATYMAQKVVREGVNLNATLEDSKNKVAGLMSLAKHSDFNAELENAGVLMTNLERAAAKLPGETSDYVEMLSLIAQPVAQAKLGLKELEQLTISATSTALTMHIDPGQAARDIEGALNGVFNSRDRFTGPLLAARGFSGEEGRSRFNQLAADKRAKEVMAAFNAPQLKDMGAALGKSFSGQLSTAEDAWHQFERALSSPLFAMLTERLTQLNEWLDQNKQAIKEVTDQIGAGLVTAFQVLEGVIGWFIEHGELTLSILGGIAAVLAAMAVLWIAGFWPIFAIIAAVSALIYGIQYLIRHADQVKKAFADAWSAIGRGAEAVADAIESAFDALADMPGIRQLIDAFNFFSNRGSSTHTAAQQRKANEDAKTMTPEEWLRAHPEYDTLPESMYPGGKMRTTPPTKRGPSDASAGAMLVPSISAGRGAYAMNIDVGGISVTSNATDPAAVAQEVSKVFDERLGYHLRRTMDEVA